MKNNIKLILTFAIIGISFFSVKVKADMTCTYTMNMNGLAGCNASKDFTIKFDNSGNPTFDTTSIDNEVMYTCGQGLNHSRDNTNNAKNYYNKYKTCPKVIVGDDGLLNLIVVNDGTVLPEFSAQATLKSSSGGNSGNSGNSGGGGGSSSNTGTVNKTVCTYSAVKMRNESWTVDIKFKIVNGVNKIEVGRTGQASTEAKVTEMVGVDKYTFSLDQNLWVPIFARNECPKPLYLSLADNSNTTITMTDKQPDASLDGSYSVVDSPTQNAKPKELSSGVTTIKDIGNVGDNFCSQKEVKRILKFFGLIILLLKLAVPFIIIVKGTFLFYNTVVKGGADDLTKSAKEFGLKIVLGIAIFFIPGLLNGILGLYNDWASVKSEYTDCATCLLDPTKCNP